MAQILKNVWRNVLSGSQISRTTLRSSTFSTSLSEVSRAKTPDAIMITIKAASSTEGVLAAVQQYLPMMTHKHLLQALRCLFELQKSGKFDDADKIIKDPTFGVLCQHFKKHARALEINETVEAIKVLSYLKVPVNTLIVQTMLQLVRANINLLNIRQIMFLDFVLDQFDSNNHLVDVLKIALPLAFQIHLPLELDQDDLPMLKDMLSYCSSHDLPDRCINNVVTGLLLHDQRFDAQIVKSIIWSLCEINCTEEIFPTRSQLLHICFDILAQRVDQLSYDDILRTAAKIKGRILEKHPEYYHEQLLDSIAGYVIKNNVPFEKGLLVARVLSRIGHTHLVLTEHLCNQVAIGEVNLSEVRTNILFAFINCLSNNNYTPETDRWRELRQQISKNPVLNANNTALPWTKFCLELASLGHYEDKLLEKVFSEKFLEQYLAREKNTLDLLQLLTLYEAVSVFHSNKYKLPPKILEEAKVAYPVHNLSATLKEAMALGLGSNEFVARNVVLPGGIVVDLLVCFKNGNPVKLIRPLKDHEKVPIEDLNLPLNSLPVCLMTFNLGCFSMNSSRLRGTFRLILDVLEKQGYVPISINVNEWLKAPAHERTPYLMREVSYKCGQLGMKLSVP